MQKNLLSVIRDKQNYWLIIELALFNFIFLSTEYLFDDMIAFFADEVGVVNAQNQVLGASVVGFVLYSFIDKIISNTKVRQIMSVVESAMACLMLIIIMLHKSYLMIMLAGVVLFILLGIQGATVCFSVSRKITERNYLARFIGISYALGIFIQFINNNMVKKYSFQGIFIIVFIIAFTVLLLQMRVSEEDTSQLENEISGKNRKSLIVAISLMVCVALMTIIFSALDAAVTLVLASGDFDIGQWPRLLLAISGIAAGFLYDMCGRKYMSAMMYIVTILATICIVVIQFGGPFIIGLLIFYMSAGFFVVFFTTSFMDLSYKIKNPKLWVGMGRAVNNFCAFITSAVSVALIASGSQFVVVITALILFALINVALLIYTQFEKDEVIDNTEPVVKVVSEEEKFAIFVEKYSLTERESEVLKALIESKDNVQTIAQHLGFSRTVLYRHIANINKKTDTSSRLEIIQFYHSSVFNGK